MSVTRYFRLLPAVVVLGTGLLVLKGVDIARAAQSAVADPDQPDNAGLAPSDNGGSPRPDFANVGDPNSSAAEVDVTSALAKRRAELDARERGLVMRENLLNAGEARVDQKIAALKQLQGQIQDLLNQRDAKQDAQIASLVKTYSAMKPKDAARIFNTLSDDVLIPVAKGMKSDVLAPILAAMNVDASQHLTVKLAAALKLPETPSTICQAPTNAADAGAPAPNTTAAAAPSEPPPVQTASLTPPQVTPLPTPPAPTVTPLPNQASAAPTAGKPAPVKPEVKRPEPRKPAAHPPAKPATKPEAKPVVDTAAKPTASKPAETAPKPADTAPKPAPTTPKQADAAPASPPPASPATSGPPTALTPPHG